MPTLTLKHECLRHNTIPNYAKIKIPKTSTASNYTRKITRHVSVPTAIYSRPISLCGPGGSVGIATGYGLEGPGSNPDGGEIFHACPDRSWGPLSLLYNGYWIFPGGKKRPGHNADPSHPSSVVGHERVELYLFSFYGPYGLCRASVPVQECT
jgi:hypothetical protein